MEIKTLFISDIHLGSKHSATTELIEFLNLIRENPPEKIYIIGDFIDGWKLKRNWYWTDNNNRIIRKLLGFIKQKVHVFICSGNHDEFLRDFIDDFALFDMGSIHLGNEFIHETVDGKKLLIIHGDRFDMVMQYARWLSVLGDLSYSLLLKVNDIFHYLRKKLGFKHWSLSKAIKKNIKQAVNYISDFEECLIKYSKDAGCNGCVCGHIHTVALKEVNGFIYGNSGDFVESCTAIYEDFSGQLHVYHHPRQ